MFLFGLLYFVVERVCERGWVKRKREKEREEGPRRRVRRAGERARSRVDRQRLFFFFSLDCFKKEAAFRREGEARQCSSHLQRTRRDLSARQSARRGSMHAGMAQRESAEEEVCARRLSLAPVWKNPAASVSFRSQNRERGGVVAFRPLQGPPFYIRQTYHAVQGQSEA